MKHMELSLKDYDKIKDSLIVHGTIFANFGGLGDN